LQHLLVFKIRRLAMAILPTASWTETVTLLPKNRLSRDASRARRASSRLHYITHSILRLHTDINNKTE